MPPVSFDLDAFTNALLMNTPHAKAGLKKEDLDIILDCLDKKKYTLVKGEKHIKIKPTKNKTYTFYICCVKCDKTDKDTSYPMCYPCYREWNALPFKSEERQKWWNVNLRPEEEEVGFLPSTDEEEEEERPPTPPSRAYSTFKGQKHPADEYEDWKEAGYPK